MAARKPDTQENTGQHGSRIRPEVSLKAEIVKETFTLFVEGRADGILEQDGRITVDEIKGVYRSLDAIGKRIYCICTGEVLCGDLRK